MADPPPAESAPVGSPDVQSDTSKNVPPGPISLQPFECPAPPLPKLEKKVEFVEREKRTEDEALVEEAENVEEDSEVSEDNDQDSTTKAILSSCQH